MDHTVKMVNIPYNMYNRLLAAEQQMIPPVVNQMADLDQDMKSILSNPNISSDAKYHQYMQIFNRHRNLKDQLYRPV